VFRGEIRFYHACEVIILKRTQIYLTMEQWRDLQIQGKKEHKSVAELIREAIDKVYRSKKESNFKTALRKVAGIWADRTDIGSSEEYVREIRKGRRLKRFGLEK